MIIGIPKEIKDKEFRIGIVPAGVKSLVGSGHEVVVENGAGLGSGISDEDYFAAGAVLTSGAAGVYEQADLVIGAVLIPGGNAPKLVTRDMLSLMKKGSVIVDVDIDQGGCVETSRPTSHSNPTFTESGIIHYCVANMPGAVPRTSTFALTNVTLPFAQRIADNGLDKALQDTALRRGVNTFKGLLTNREVARAQDREYSEPAL